MKTRNVHNLPLLAISFLLALIAYSTILNSFFLSDDFEQIGRVLEGDWSFTWGLEQGGFFRPLFIWSYVVDGTLWGTNPFGYHLTNIALHALNSYLVYILSGRLLRRNGHDAAISLRISAAAGLIFLLLPSHTEAVSWISGRADLLATVFSLAALIFYDSYMRERSSSYLAATVGFFMLALLAKESALCLPLIIIAMELSVAADQRQAVDLKQVIRAGVLLGLILLVYLLIRYAAIGSFIGGYGPRHHLNFNVSLIWERLPKYFVRALLPPLPHQLSFMLFKPFKSRAFIAFAVMFVGALSTLIVFRHRWQSPTTRKQQNVVLLLLLILFLCSLLPVITMGISVFDTSGERLVYLPSVFTSIAIAYIVAAFIANPKLWILSVGCLLIFYSANLYRSNQRWREAANLSKSILNDLASLSRHDDLLVMNAPDSLQGAPVYQNGLTKALTTFQRTKKIRHLDLVSLHSLLSTTDVIEMVRESNLVSMRLLDAKAEFSRINDQMECVEIRRRSQTSLTVELKECVQGKDVFYFQKGKMVELSAFQSAFP
ncbi:MAG: hypothetical protein ABR568_00660 [Pyrinomonadaceae bacterium]